MRGLKNLVRNIRASDEPTRRRWLIGLLVIAVLLLLPLWFSYVASEIPVLTGEQKPKKSAFLTGIEIFLGETVGIVQQLPNPITKTNEITIEATSTNESVTQPEPTSTATSTQL